MKRRLTPAATKSHKRIAPTIVKPTPRYRNRATANPTPASAPANSPSIPVAVETLSVFPHALHVTVTGRPFHQGTPARSPQNGQLSRATPAGPWVIRGRRGVLIIGPTIMT